jgi:hypothetical protein
MKEHKITSREMLKTYFEKGDNPTQDQFAELIDAFKHREDIPTNKEAVILANSLASIDNAYLAYYGYNFGKEKILLTINSQDDGEQLIDVSRTNHYQEQKKYFFGTAPYSIKIKEFRLDELSETEYYYFSYQLKDSLTVERVIGNNLPVLSEGLDLGTFTEQRFYLSLSKLNFGQRINNVSTNIKFINNTNVNIMYRAQANYWGSLFSNEDSVTNHYNLWDNLYFYYNANLNEINQHIECKVYNADNKQLIMTGYLYAGQNNEYAWGGDVATGIRNIRIECIYQDNQNNQINFK